MRWIWVAAMVVAAGCAGSRAASRADAPATATRAQEAAKAPTPPQAAAQPEAAQKTFIDKEHGFEIARPDGNWTFKEGKDLSTDTIDVPVVIANKSTGAQIVVQVAPAVATPSQFAERLTMGLRSRAGFVTSDITPIPLADGAVGFNFAVANEVSGRVAILEGGEGRVYVLLATWPHGAPGNVEQDVDGILRSLKPMP